MPLADVMGTAAQEIGGVFSADGARATFSGVGFPNGGVGMLIQNMGLAYSKALSQLWEITSNLVYFVGGRSQGRGSMGRILGPQPIQMLFYEKYGNVCYAAGRNLGFKGVAGCGGAAGINGVKDVFDFQANGVTVDNMNVTFGAQDMLINDAAGFQYASLLKSENATPFVPGGGFGV
jgi:hypothetical protein